MATVSKSFTAAGTSLVLAIKPGQSVTYSVTGTFTGFVYLERQRRFATWEVIAGGTADTGFSGTSKNETKREESYRFRAEDTDGENPITGTAVCSIADADDTLRELTDPGTGQVLVKFNDDGIVAPEDMGVTGDLSVTGTASVTGAATVTGNLSVEGGAVRLGAADAAAPAAQAVNVQSVLAGETDTAGVALTVNGSRGTGSGAGGSIIFKVAPAGGSGTSQNALATAATIAGDKSVAFVHSVVPATAVAVASLPATPAVGMIAQVNDATTPSVGSTVADGGAAAALVWYNGSNWTVIGV